MAGRRNKPQRQTEHDFARIPKANIPRSMFNRSHTHKTVFDSGWLVPVYVDEVLPGDSFNLQMTGFGRLATPIFPIMDNMVLDVFFFFVPYRLVWSNWQKFCGEQEDPDSSTDFTVPQITGHVTTGHGLLMDYMGVPPTPGVLSVSALPHRSYGLIWNEWFRDQNMQDSLTIKIDDGPELWSQLGSAQGGMQRRGKRHDYFTSCLPFPSKHPGIEIPLADTAPVGRIAPDQPAGFMIKDVGAVNRQAVLEAGATGATQRPVVASWPGGADWTGTEDLLWGDVTGLQVELGLAGGTINSLRQAFQIQKLFERDARGGTRYTEIVKSHFGVVSPDARLQRPEYLGGGTIPLIMNPIAQSTQKTSAASWDQTEKGSLSGFGVASGQVGFNKSFTEHGTIIGLISARADLTYQQGLARMWSRSTRYDFYWPVFQSLGEQAVLNQEIFVQDPTIGSPPDNTAVFGYNERWAEYRFHPSRVSHLFRSQAAGTLEAWHLALDFGSTLPVLGSTFIKDDPPVDRCIAVNTEPHWIFDSYFQIKCARPMPVYSVPGMIDHF